MSRWRQHKRLLAALAAGPLVLGVVTILDVLFPPPIARITTSTIVTDEQGLWLHGFAVVDEDDERRWRLQADLDDIDPVFVERLIAIEDKRFHAHHGVDLIAVLRAAGNMVRHGEIVSGASTITMQTARLMEPRPRTLGSKMIEMIRAVQIERRLSKDEILELYLTLAPYGGNLQGVRAASLAWFGKEPAALTDAQQALLIALPQAPEARRPDRNPQAAAAARARILEKLGAVQMLAPARIDEALEAGLPLARRPFPRLAWHASFEHRARAASGGEVALTLLAPMQEMLEAETAAAVIRHSDDANIAVLIIENQSRKVRAVVGSADLSRPGGWIDMTRARRSPGSTLKPFIYGLAFEDGFAASDTLIDDAPYSFDGYRPENFTRVFHGDVTVREALQHSLNVPAVLALDRIGPRRFAASLTAAGVDARMPAAADAKASLAIALGGIGLTARDLAMLYTGLARGGDMAPLLWSDDAGAALPPYRLLTSESTSRLTSIMRQAPAPAGRSPAFLSRRAPQIAFKTGTSYGYRDAWAAGYTEDYTVVVWAGNPNGTPRPGITGREGALPLLFDVFDRLQAFPPAAPGVVPEGGTDRFETGAALARLSPLKRDLPPEIVFPEDGITIFRAEAAEGRGFALSARGGAGGYRWYVDGLPVERQAGDGRNIWQPASPGFYQVTVIDAAGRRSDSAVRVEAAG